MVIKIGREMYTGMFVNEKVVDLYLSLGHGSLYSVSRKNNTTYAHASKLVSIWEAEGLIRKKIDKERLSANIINYTKRGKSLQIMLSGIKVYLTKNNFQWRGGESEDDM